MAMVFVTIQLSGPIASSISKLCRRPLSQFISLAQKTWLILSLLPKTWENSSLVSTVPTYWVKEPPNIHHLVVNHYV